ncbi:MAG: hypothetical protein M9892_07500 [Bacteroidetes bacterium]|nr:hypothetical protein [Bacteroidota bacterium]
MSNNLANLLKGLKTIVDAASSINEDFAQSRLDEKINGLKLEAQKRQKLVQEKIQYILDNGSVADWVELEKIYQIIKNRKNNGTTKNQ